MDWRTQLRRNERRTKIVMVLFILIYMSMGFLCDLYLNDITPQMQQNWIMNPAAPTLSQLAYSLITFHIFPTATFVMGIVALIGIWITYQFHDKIILMGTTYTEVTHQTTKLEETQLYNVVEEMKVAAGLRYMPKIFIIEADYMNAFASGYSEKSALVAITRGLLTKLDRNELQAVMAHELSHIRHHDIKLTLTATVLANLTLLVVDLLFWGTLSNKDRRDSQLGAIIMILRYLLPLVTIVLMLYLSRTREYMADAGCVELMRDNTPLGNALLKIHQDHTTNQKIYATGYHNQRHEQLRAGAYLYDPIQAGISVQDGLSSLFSTHPLIKDRLAALGFKAEQK